ncbi:MAG: carbonic anhydrase [Desulfobulbaceae bacterium]|jgi:carbonic anhydrase|nr:carbonic anhydrase [Desulfobulbaceae bacterium]
MKKIKANNAMNWNDALDRLKKGNDRFVQDKLNGKLQDSERKNSLTGGQSPYAIILSCADSRVVPELAFDTGLGEIFVVRVAGNVANTSSIASIEYAIVHLGTKLIVVMGHESCGAVTAAVAGGDNGNNLNHLLGHIAPVVNKNQGADLPVIIKENAKASALGLVNNSPIISDAVESKGVKIVSAYYNLKDGKVDFD